MPQSDQILHKAKVTPLVAGPAGADNGSMRYSIDFSVDPKDVDFKPAANGAQSGIVNFTLLVYDRYGKIVGHQAHVAALALQPEAYARYKKTGIPLHAEVAAPNGNYWLRTGIYDENSGKVGTLEIPLAAVKPLEANSTASY